MTFIIKNRINISKVFDNGSSVMYNPLYVYICCSMKHGVTSFCISLNICILISISIIIGTSIIEMKLFIIQLKRFVQHDEYLFKT